MNPLYLLLVPMGVVVGAFSAAFGIGGGLLMVPIMVLGYGIEQHAAQGTSLLVIVPAAIAGAIAHHRRGLVDWRLALWMGIGGIGGAYVGAKVALATGSEVLQAIFGGVVIAGGIRLILQGRALGGRDAA